MEPVLSGELAEPAAGPLAMTKDGGVPPILHSPLMGEGCEALATQKLRRSWMRVIAQHLSGFTDDGLKPILVRSPQEDKMAAHRIFATSVASVYPHYVAKAERKGRTRAEVDAVIAWLTGYDAAGLAAELDAGTDFENFFAHAPRMNPDRELITGTVCGVRVEDVLDPLMKEIRIFDKLIDELAKGKAMGKVYARYN